MPTSLPTPLPYPAYGTPAPGIRSSAVEPGVPQVVTLKQAIHISFARSPLLQAARADTALASAGVALQRAGLLPNITGSANLTRVVGQAKTVTGGGQFSPDVTSEGLSATLRQLVYDGGKLVAEIRSAKHSESAQIDTYRRTLQTVAYNVAQAYYASLAAGRTTLVDAELVHQNIVQRDLVAAQAQAGTAARADIATAEFPVAQARLALVQAQGAELSAQAAFANAMGLDANTNVLPSDDTPVFTLKALSTIPVPTYAQAIARADAMRPDYDAAKQTAEASWQLLLAAKRGVFPTLSGTAQTGTSSTNISGGDFRPSSTLGLQLSVPIFAPGVLQAAVAQGQANLDLSQAQRTTAQEQVQLDVKQGLVNFISARAAVDQANAEYAQAQTVLQSTQAQYKAGVTTLPLLLNAEVGFTTALNDQVKTIYALRQAEQAFLYAEGDNDQ